MNSSCRIDIGDDGCASLMGAMTFDSTPELFQVMEAHLQQNGDVLSLDLSGVKVVDSAGLALLLEWQSVKRASGGELVIGNAPSSLLRLAHLCEAVELLNLSGRGKET
jgi:anti-anti-sigma factor